MMTLAILNAVVVLAVAAGNPQEAPIVMPAPDYWQIARNVTAVVKGNVRGSAPAQRQLTLAVTAVLKGKDVPAQLVLSWPYENTLPTGQDCLVFLGAGQGSGYRISAVVSDARTIGEAMAIVRDVLAVDACTTDRAKCQTLVELILRDGSSRRYAARELEGFREEEHLALLEPLSKDPATLTVPFAVTVAIAALGCREWRSRRRRVGPRGSAGGIA